MQMAPELLNTETGMNRKEIELSRQLAIMTSENNIRREFQGEVKGVREEISGVKGQISGVQSQVIEVQKNVTALQSGQGELKATLTQIQDKLALIAEQLVNVSHETETIRTDTADGIILTKKVTVYKSFWMDAKKPVVWLAGGVAFLVWEIVKAWAVSHGYTFQSLFQK